MAEFWNPTARPDPVGRTYGALAAAPLLATVRDPLRCGSLLACRAVRVVAMRTRRGKPRRFRTAETVFSKPLPAMPGTRCGPPAEAGTRLPSEDASDCNAVRCSAQYHAWPFRGSDRLCGTRALS